MELLWNLFPTVIVSAVVAAIVTVFNNRRSLQDSLDTKSGWRKDIFNVASKTIITTDDVYLLLAALRYKPTKAWDESSNEIPEDFEEMTAYMYFKFDKIIMTQML